MNESHRKAPNVLLATWRIRVTLGMSLIERISNVQAFSLGIVNIIVVNSCIVHHEVASVVLIIGTARVSLGLHSDTIMSVAV